MLTELIKEAAEKAGLDPPTQNTDIVVEFLDLRWFFTFKSNFVAFSTILTEMPVSFYSLKFTKILLNHYWNETQKKIIISQFIPYIALALLTIIYFHYSLTQDYVEDKENMIGFRVVLKIIGVAVLALICNSLRTEWRQVMSKSHKLDYFAELFNWIDLTGLFLTSFIVIVTIFE